jgi:hypothetical protein
MSNVEHLVSIELHHLSFIVITMDCDNQDHLHSIIINTEIPHTKLSIFGLLDIIQNTSYESIWSDLQSMQWKEDDGSELPPSTLHRRLTRLQVLLMMSLNMEEARNRALYNLAVDVSNSTSKGSIPDSGRGYLKSKLANPR